MNRRQLITLGLTAPALIGLTSCGSATSGELERANTAAQRATRDGNDAHIWTIEPFTENDQTYYLRALYETGGGKKSSTRYEYTMKNNNGETVTKSISGKIETMETTVHQLKVTNADPHGGLLGLTPIIIDAGDGAWDIDDTVSGHNNVTVYYTGSHNDIYYGYSRDTE